MLSSDWIALCIWMSSLGVAVGYGCASRRVALRGDYILALLLIVVLICMLSIYFGRWTGEFLPPRLLDILAGIGLIIIGLLISSWLPQYPGTREQLLFGLVLITAASISGVELGGNGKGGFFSLLIVLILLGGVVGGYLLGQKRVYYWRFYHLKPYLAGLVLIFLGLIKLF